MHVQRRRGPTNAWQTKCALQIKRSRSDEAAQEASVTAQHAKAAAAAAAEACSTATAALRTARNATSNLERLVRLTSRLRVSGLDAWVVFACRGTMVSSCNSTPGLLSAARRTDLGVKGLSWQ